MDGLSRGPKRLAFPLLQGSPGPEGSAKLSIRGLPRCLLIPIPRKGPGTHISGAGQCSIHLRWPLGTGTTGLPRSLSTHECHASLDASNDGLPDSAVTGTPQDFWTGGSKSRARLCYVGGLSSRSRADDALVSAAAAIIPRRRRHDCSYYCLARSIKQTASAPSIRSGPTVLWGWEGQEGVLVALTDRHTALKCATFAV